MIWIKGRIAPLQTDDLQIDEVDAYTQMSVDSFIQDVDIWNNKVRIDNPLMCDGDGPVHMLRKWYSQFYMDVAEIPAALTVHKEHETKIKPRRGQEQH